MIYQSLYLVEAEFEASLKRIENSRKDLSIDMKEVERKEKRSGKGLGWNYRCYKKYWLRNTISIKNSAYKFFTDKDIWEYTLISVTLQRACINCRPALSEAGSTFP